MSKKYEDYPCLRCVSPLVIVGTKKFDEGTDWTSWLGDWGKLLNRQERLEMLGCTKCGKVEFYFEGAFKEEK